MTANKVIHDVIAAAQYLELPEAMKDRSQRWTIVYKMVHHLNEAMRNGEPSPEELRGILITAAAMAVNGARWCEEQPVECPFAVVEPIEEEEE